MIDFIIIGIVLIIVAAASFYVYRAKKNGQKCIGCSVGCSCGTKKEKVACQCGSKPHI